MTDARIREGIHHLTIRAAVDVDGLITFSVSSQEPVERPGFVEILDHSPRSVRLDRIRDGGPLLREHDRKTQIGVVEKAELRGRRLYVSVRFGAGDLAQEERADVASGIRRNVSLAYRIHRAEMEPGLEGEPDRLRVLDWEPFEISLVSIPADVSVGVGRSANYDKRSGAARQEGRSVTISYRKLWELDQPERLEAMADWPETKRQNAIEAMRQLSCEQVAKNFKAPPDLLKRAIDQGHTPEQLCDAIRQHRERTADEPYHPPASSLDFERSLASRDPVFGLDQHDVRDFSLFRAIGALASGRPDEAPEEFAISDHIRRTDPQRNYQARGLTLPHSVLAGLASRSIGKTSPNTTGAALVGVEHMGGSFIGFLSPFLAVQRAGATIINATGPDLSIPRQISGSATSWVTEGAGSGEDSPAFDPVTLSPKTVRARSDMTRRMLLQSQPELEGIMTSELARSLGQAVDAAALAGGGGAAPQGILGLSGVADVTYSTASGAAERQVFLEMQDAVAATDPPMAAPGLIISSSMRSRLMGLSVDVGSGVFVATETDDPRLVRIAGIPSWVSNNTPRTEGAGSNEHVSFFADWSELLMALWSTVDIQIDPITLGDSGGLVVRAFQDIDIAVRHATSFAVTQVNPAA